jgi:hypothetical protein
MPLVGFGVFVMLQKQMVGIRERAERLARERIAPPARKDAKPVGTRNGHGHRAEGTEVVAGPAS